MKKLFMYSQSLMNGTVTMSTEVGLFATRELAEETKKAIINYNKDKDLDGLWVDYTEIKEINVYETKDEIPFFQKHQDL